MLNKKSIKILSIVVMIVMLLMTMGNVAFADPITVPDPKAPNGDEMTELNTTVSSILGIIQWAGIIAAVVIAMFIGIKYITAAPDGKAEIKKTLGFYVAGMALLLSASVIVRVIQNVLP